MIGCHLIGWDKKGASMQLELIGKCLALGCALVWAVSVIFFKRSGETIRPVALNLYKTLVGAVLLIPVIYVYEKTLVPPDFSRTDLWALCISGIIGITIADSLFFKCLNLIGAGLTAIVDCLYSPFMILAAFVMLGETAGIPELAGAVMVIGAIMIATVQTRSELHTRRDLFMGIFVGAAGMLAMAVSVAIMKPCLDHIPVLWVTEIRILFAVSLLIIQIAVHSDRRELTRSIFQRSNWRYAFPGAFMGNVIAMTMWVTAFKLTNISTASVLNQTSTIFVVFLATFFLKETLTIRKIIAMFLAFGGAVLVILG
jgi:drug/metabolite transporter (DMT)-like permease